MKRLEIVVLAALGGLVGCGSGSANPDGGGSPGSAGATGGGGHGGSGGGGTGALPSCAITTRPPNGVAPACNTIELTGGWVSPEPFVEVDGGVRADGGAVEEPTGGTILDGDYDMVRWQNSGTNPTRRTIRVFDGGTYIEWRAINQNPTIDGGMQEYDYNTTVSAAGNTLTFLSYPCNAGISISIYEYFVQGEDLAFFDGGGGSPIYAVDTYQRTCRR